MWTKEEIVPGSPELREEAVPVNQESRPWLRDALAGGPNGAPPLGLNASAAVVVDLPAGLSFVSVLGPRFRRPGDLGECRFVFNPPLQSWGLFGNGQVNYTYVDQGNPLFVNITYPRQRIEFADPAKLNGFAEVPGDQPQTIENVHLLDQQLNASIQYTLAIVQGPSSAGVIGAPGTLNRTSPGGCAFTKIETWHR